MIEAILWIIFIGSALLLAVVILLQEAKGGGLAEAFGGMGAQTFGVKASGGILDGQPFPEIGHWVRLLAVFDVVFLAISFMTFDYVVEE